MLLCLSAVVGNCLTLKKKPSQTISGRTQLVSKGDLTKIWKYTAEKKRNSSVYSSIVRNEVPNVEICYKTKESSCMHLLSWSYTVIPAIWRRFMLFTQQPSFPVWTLTSSLTVCSPDRETVRQSQPESHIAHCMNSEIALIKFPFPSITPTFRPHQYRLQCSGKALTGLDSYRRR